MKADQFKQKSRPVILSEAKDLSNSSVYSVPTVVKAFDFDPRKSVADLT